MELTTQEFIYRRNVLNYITQLRDAPSEERRRMLLSLLAEEAVKARRAGWMPYLGGPD